MKQTLSALFHFRLPKARNVRLTSNRHMTLPVPSP